MAHLSDSISTTRATETEWLKVASQVGTLVNAWSLRGDLVAYVGTTMSNDVPALFNPRTAEIEVNSKIAFGVAEPELVGDLTDRSMQFEFPKATGAILHEALHARFTRWSLEQSHEDLSPQENEALHLLEEGRIESLGVLTFPKNREFLRTSALEIVLHDMDTKALAEGGIRSLANLAGLIGARVDGEVLDISDVSDVITVLRDSLGTDLYESLRTLWIKAQSHTDHANALPLYELAREWERLVSDKAAEKGEEPTAEEKQKLQELLESLKDMIGEANEETSFSAGTALSDQQTGEEWAKEVEARSNESKTKTENKAEATKVFSKGTGPMPDSATRSKLTEKRLPTSAERIAAVKVSQILEKAKYRERSVTEVSSITPPGRLRTRALVQANALKSKGVMAQTEAWRKTVRKHTEDPTLTVGVMVDISGSMGDAMAPMATTAWVMSEATRRVQGKCAMVYYGSDVFPTLKPGQHLPEVEVYTAPDGTEKFDKAFKALDGSLNLLYGTGARLLVVVSDGHYTSDETKKAKEWMKACERNGVAILWLTFDSTTGHLGQYLNGTSGQAESLFRKDVNEAAVIIGKASATALTKTTMRSAA
jgi:hypothetical protein